MVKTCMQKVIQIIQLLNKLKKENKNKRQFNEKLRLITRQKLISLNSKSKNIILKKV